MKLRQFAKSRNTINPNFFQIPPKLAYFYGYTQTTVVCENIRV